MSTPGTVFDEPMTDTRLGLTERASRHPAIAALTSGLLLWTSFPPLEWSWLAWVALTPLFWLVLQAGPRWRLYISSWLGGVLFWMLSVQWVRLTDASAWLAWVVMALVFSLWWPGFLALARLAVHRLKLPLMVAAPILWVGLEHLRAYILTGFPWYYLGHSQFRSLTLIQLADVAGALGVSFLIAVVNAWLVDLLTLPLLRPTSQGPRLTAAQARRLALVALLFGGNLIYGSYRLSTARFREGPRLALLQTNFEQRYKMGADPVAILQRIQQLVARAIAREPRPDLIVWPETSYPYSFIDIDPTTTPETLAGQVRQINDQIVPADWITKQQDIANNLHEMTDAVRVPMLVGSLLYDHRPEKLSKYNSAILFEPAVRTIHAYHKIHLVPFGEFIPFLDAFPWLTIFTPYRNGYVPTLTFGHEPNTLTLGPYRIAMAICFEDTVPHGVRRFFREAPADRQPDLLVNISNDGWFHGSSELDTHLAVSVFRTIENRVPLVRAVNTGLSALIDGNGEIRDLLPRMTESVLSVNVPLDDRTSLYTAWGDWMGLTCLSVTIGLVPMGWLRRYRSRGPAAA